MRLAPLLLALAWVLPASAATRETRIPEASLKVAGSLRERALADNTAWKLVESLTTEVGPRPAGSAGDARAVKWAQARFEQLGYDNVRLQPVKIKHWVRRSERGEVLGAHAQPLTLTALGGSPGGTVEGEVVRFADFASLEAAADGTLAGKIAFVDYRMQRARDGSDYRNGSQIRGRGPSAAIKKGAIGFLMRSAGTDHTRRSPHTGATRFVDGVTPVPSAALANPDADQLARLVALGPTRVRVALDTAWEGETTSYNVIGEIRGRGKPDEVVMIGGHLDSWDLGTGAIDDGAGIGITMAAGHLIGQLKKRPARTIRVVAFANEEHGLDGARTYAEAQAGNIARHQLVAESDFGAGRVYAFNTGAPAHAAAAEQQIADALKPLGIELTDKGGPGPDLGPIAQRDAAWASLLQDGTDYFDYHHTPDDTLDKIDPQALAQNVAAYAVFAYLAAEADGDFGSEATAVTPPRE
ncbi:MAG: M28 family peptidase [Luteimonas sp.]